jgi:hypothetical protein
MTYDVLIILLMSVIIWLVHFRQTERFTLHEVPRTIWTYWDDDKLPEMVEKSIENWKRYSIGWTINVVTPSNLGEFLPGVNFDQFRPGEFVQRKVDLIRLYLISKYGGVWSDASIAVKRSHDWIIDEMKTGGYEFLGYYREGSTRNSNYPVIENWMFAAIPNCEFVKKWRDEFEKTGSYKDINKYIEDVKRSGVDVQDIPDPAYLTPYVSAQVVMQKYMTPDEIKTKIKVIKSDDGPFKHSTMNEWDPQKSMKWLCDQPDSELPDVIKVYGNERRAVEGNSSLKCSYKIFD